MGKRQARTKISKDKSINIMEPIPFEKLGTLDDPCFGQFHDPTTDECNRCGDSEICSIVCSQKLHIKRQGIEAEQPFKDIGEINLTWKNVYKACRKILINNPRISKLDVVKKRVMADLSISSVDFDNLLKVTLRKRDKLKVKGQTIKYKA